MFDTFAASKRRPARYNNDIDAFREYCGGALTGTYYCVLPLGTSVIYDVESQELLNAEGVIIADQGHIHEEFKILCLAVQEATALAQAQASQGQDSSEAPMPQAFEGLLLRANDGTGYFQIVDMHHPSLCLWQQINVLTDLFCLLEKKIPHLRFSPHNPTSALRSPAQFRRWIAPWRKPGIAGVLIKKADFIAGSEHTDTDVCLVRCR